MGNKDNPIRPLRKKALAGTMGVLLLAGGTFAGYGYYEQGKTVTKQESLISKYQETLVEQGSLIDQQESELSNQKETLSLQQEQLESLNQQVSDFQKELKSKNETMEGYKQQISSLEGEVSSLKKKKAEREATRQAAAAQPTAQTASASTPPSRGSSEPTGRQITVEATAYTAYCAGCSGKTATGFDLRANPQAKVIAVDPSVIPLGTKVYVPGYGHAVASDTGGAIKGNKIDVFIPDKQQVYAWGRRTVTITILN